MITFEMDSQSVYVEAGAEKVNRFKLSPALLGAEGVVIRIQAGGEDSNPRGRTKKNRVTC